MIELATFKKSSRKFDKLERRTSFFSLAQNLIKNGFEAEGMLLVLTTWNFAGFRYAVKGFDIENFQKTLNKLQPHFQRLKDKTFPTIRFYDYSKDISIIYNALSKIKGIQHTGASKLMHLKCPNVFVMWDGYIRGEKPKIFYKDLAPFKTGTLHIRKYKTDAQSYIEFLKDMQAVFGDLHFNDDGKALTKAIDEYNYINITQPIQKMEKNRKIKSKLAID
jgi:hypothetical protein